MLRVGICGCGSIAKFRHVPEYAQNPNVKIKGYFDLVNKRAQDLSRKYGGRVYESAKSLFEDKELDAVSICSPNRYHAEQSIMAANLGKHVLCEKPMATTIIDCQEMILTAKNNGLKLMIALNQRLAPAHIKAKELIQNGEIGKVLTFRTAFGHPGPESWSADKGVQTWFFKKEEALLGSMGDLGVHKIDLLRWLLDDNLCEVSAIMATLLKKDAQGNAISVDDNAAAILKFKCGVFGTMASSWTYFGKEDNSTVLYGTLGTIKIYDNINFPLVVEKKSGEEAFYKIGKIATNEEQVKSGIVDKFVDCILNDTKPIITGEDAISTMKAVFALIESNEKGKRVTID